MLVLFWTTLTTFAQELPRESLVPGGVAVIPLGEDPASLPEATFNGNKILVVQSDGLWHAIVGLALSTTPGEHRLHARGADNTERDYLFQVEAKEYAEQRITLANARQVNPTKRDLRRIARESKRMQAVFASYTPRAMGDLLLDMPADGELSGNFGLRRFFNGEARNPHAGIDFAAPTGAPVRAPADGTVALIGDYFFNGKSVFLDHGQGMISMMNHLSRIDVRKGDMVKRGDVIGAVGATGRATGPHLHWTLSLNNSRVDPMLFLAQPAAAAAAPAPDLPK
jgi:murein DD-endopeptidase MepM/ murein hydrolase activator NlpD